MNGTHGNETSVLLTWKRIWLILILIGVIWMLMNARAALTPLIISFILAYILHPLVDILERRRIPRTAAVLILLLAVALVIFVLWVSIAPLVERQFSAFAQRMPGYIKVAESWVERMVQRFQLVPAEDVRRFITQNLSSLGRLPLEALQAGGNFLLQTTRGIVSLVLGAAYLALIPVMTFYLLRDMNKLSGMLFTYIHPAFQPEVRKRLDRLDELLGSFIKGQLTVGVILSVLYVAGFYLVGLPLWLVLGLITGIVSMFPYVEWIVALPLAIGLAALAYQDWLHPLAVLAVFGVVSPVGGMFIVPRVVGDRVGLHPVVVIASIMIGGELMGFMGILLAVPLAAAIKVGLEAVYDYYIADTKQAAP
ncbi:MAG: AI-2E family transporter [Candidatus Tectomicrobia bacterium]|uniref:AI-2E family transporter n=1 Tax=Tectimicrobiota bacterium TaxID=2528274 RepID=A0A932I1K9_UNCTE|nr:AI-2E family transporter [Candidatus Tectomicrobia bacterium]